MATKTKDVTVEEGTHVVLRSFTGPGGAVLEPGDQVDARPWRWTTKLEEQGFIRPIFDQASFDPNLIKSAVQAEIDRLAAEAGKGASGSTESDDDGKDEPKTGSENTGRHSRKRESRSSSTKTGKETKN